MKPICVRFGSVILGVLLQVGGSRAAEAEKPRTYEAPLDMRKDGEAKFTAPPKAETAGDGVKVSFAVAAAADVEVAILDAKGRAVRHLAAGLLGRNAPAPFKKDALVQEVVWDRKDDLARRHRGQTPPVFRQGREECSGKVGGRVCKAACISANKIRGLKVFREIQRNKGFSTS